MSEVRARVSRCRGSGCVALALVVSLVGSGCKGDDQAPPRVGPPPSPPPSRPTASYLSEAIDASRVFRWTAAAGEQSIVVPIQVDDRTLSAATASAMRAVVNEARDAWKAAIAEAVPFDTATRWLSTDQPFASSLCHLEILFVARIAGALGSVSMTSVGTGKIGKVTLRLALESEVANRALTTEELRAVALHEFGHAYGIYKFGAAQGHTSQSGSVMYEGGSSWTTLADGDKATMRALYALTPTERRQDDASFAPPPEITVAYASAYPNGISLELRGARYQFFPNQTLRLRLAAAQDALALWECPRGGCRWTTFPVQASVAYKVVDVSGGGLRLVLR